MVAVIAILIVHITRINTTKFEISLI